MLLVCSLIGKQSLAGNQQYKVSLQGSVHLSMHEKNLNGLPLVSPVAARSCRVRYIDVVSLTHDPANQETVM